MTKMPRRSRRRRHNFVALDWRGAKRNPRQNRVEDTTRTGCAADANPAALSFDQFLGQRQAQARAGVLLGSAGVQLLELDEEPVQIVVVDTAAGVFDFDAESGRRRRA